MSATEIIEQIKVLPPEERQQIVDFIRTAERAEAPDPTPVRYADDRTFKAVTERIFEEHAELFKKLAE